MKYIFTCIVIFSALVLSAQTNQKVTNNSSEYNLISPEFPGGKAAKNHFLSTNIQYPLIAKENKIQGVVEFRFIVELDGTLTNFQILKDPGGGLGEEAIRVYKLMPKWIPGDLYNQAARVPIAESLIFKLHSSPSKKSK